MPKINDTTEYPVVTPTTDDTLIGTNGSDGKTKNFTVASIVALGDAALATHAAATTAVHGIADTGQVALLDAANTFAALNAFQSGTSTGVGTITNLAEYSPSEADDFLAVTQRTVADLLAYGDYFGATGLFVVQNVADTGSGTAPNATVYGIGGSVDVAVDSVAPDTIIGVNFTAVQRSVVGQVATVAAGSVTASNVGDTDTLIGLKAAANTFDPGTIATAQTAIYARVRNFSSAPIPIGHALHALAPSGDFSVYYALRTDYGETRHKTGAASVVGLSIERFTGQTAHLFDALDSDGATVLSFMDKDGVWSESAIPALPQSKIADLASDLALKAPLVSPALTGTPTAPTATNATDSTQIATTAFVHALITALLNSAPANLDTLGEIAAQLAGDESALSALITTVSGKLAKASNLSDLTDASAARTNLGLGTAAQIDTGTGAVNVPTTTQADARYAQLAASNLFTLRQDIRANGGGNAAGLYVPWVTGDALPAIYAGSPSAGMNQIGIRGESNSSVGVQGFSSSSDGIRGLSSTGNPIHARKDGSNTNSIGIVALLNARTSASPVVSGFGAALRYRLQSDTTVDQDAGQVAALWTDATHATRTAALAFSAALNGTLAEKARITGQGALWIGRTSGGLTGAGDLDVAGNVAIAGTIATGTWQGTKVGLAYGGTNADLSATGGANQVVKQGSAGGALSVALLNSTDMAAANDYTAGALVDHLFYTPTSGNPYGPIGITQSVTGTAAAVTQISPPDASAMGVVQLDTGTQTVGRGTLASQALASIRFGGVAQSVEWRFQLPNLPDGTESFALYVGFGDSVTAAPTDGAYVYFDQSTAHLRFRTRSNSNETDGDTGVTPSAATWYIARVAVNAAGSSAVCTIYSGDRTSVLGTVTNSANIPTGAGRETGIVANIIKSAGTTSRKVYLDLVRLGWGGA